MGEGMRESSGRERKEKRQDEQSRQEEGKVGA